MKYLEIKSFGEIDPKAFSLIGASTKKNQEGKIGFFGSGASYAISALLRKQIDFRIYSGEDEVRVTTRKTDFRGQDFDVILINGQETSLTTTMGGNDWDTAFAPIREIYSNALDEDESASLKSVPVENITPEKGYTKFFIEMNGDVEHFYKNLHLYFCGHNPKVLFTCNEGSVYENTDDGCVRIFRKGILAHHDAKKKALFHYNLNNIEINESRVVKYSHQIDMYVAKVLKSCSDDSIINKLLLQLHGGNSGYLEHEASWNAYNRFHPVWEEVCRDKRFAPVEYLTIFDTDEIEDAYLLPVSLLKALKGQFPELNVLGLGKKTDDVFTVKKPSQILIDKVIDALSMLNSTRYKHRLDNPVIEYVRFQNEKVLGMADDGVIYLSTKLDTSDVPAIARVIIEENEHNLTGYNDETRLFQDHLFNLYFDELMR